MFRFRPIKYKLPNGEVIELVTIGVLAKTLGKTSQIIQKLEWKGVLPKTPFRSKRGHRLYSQEQIDIIVKYDKKYDKIKRNYSQDFIDNVKKDHDALLIKYGIKVR